MSALLVICVGTAFFGLGVIVEYWAATRYVEALEAHVRVLKGQVAALREHSDKAGEAAERWKVAANIAQAEWGLQRDAREVAERRLALMRENMHREREP